MVQKIKSTQVELMNGILNNDPKIIRDIYLENYDRIKNMVNNFYNIKMDADDVFQDGLTQAIINIRKGAFKGDSLFSTYLYGICRNICLKAYNKNKGHFSTELHDIPEEINDDHFDSIQLMLQLKEQFNTDCKTIIDLRFGIGQVEKDKSELRFDAIAKTLNILPDNARQKFRRCMNKLMDLVKKTNLMETY